MRSAVGMVPPGQSDIVPKVNALQVVVTVEADGVWQVAHFQNTPAAFHQRPEAVDDLTAELHAVLASEDNADR